MAHEWQDIKVNDKWFQDSHGRKLLLRGVNMSGNSKLPSGPMNAWNHNDPSFYDHRNVTFIGRPFHIYDVDEHFSRLHRWGLTFTRLLVTWEALEHEGPGIYDDEFIDYLITVLHRAQKFGIKCFIDPHQDTWSRFSGGSGAPGWTFEVVGLNLKNFLDTGAVVFHDFESEDDGKMLWPTNYIKLASATMFTVFFGGEIFAPKTVYQGVSAQEYLQSHFIKAYMHLAKRIKESSIDHVVTGFEVINEPHPGYIGLKSLKQFDPIKDLHLSSCPTPIQSFFLGLGNTVKVDYYVKSWPWPTRKSGTRVLNEKKVSAWLPNHDCIWKQHGLYEMKDGVPFILEDNYFTKKRDGKPINFEMDCYLPFIKKFTQGISSVMPEAIIFFEPVPNDDPPHFDNSWDHSRVVYAPHWYDLKSVFSKSFNGIITHDVRGLSRGTKNVIQASYFGMNGANRNYQDQVENIVGVGISFTGKRPTLFGECGIPMDMNEKQAFETGDYSHHTNFLDAVINAMESNLVNFTLWNYNPVNDHHFGDYWNGEDFSIFSPAVKRAVSTDKKPKSKLRLNTNLRKEITNSPLSLTPNSPFDITEAVYMNRSQSEYHKGGRALDAVIRPYAAKIAGEPKFMRFSIKTSEFIFEFTNAPTTSDVTEIFLPSFHYPDVHRIQFEVSDGFWVYKPENQTFYWTIDKNVSCHRVVISTIA